MLEGLKSAFPSYKEIKQIDPETGESSRKTVVAAALEALRRRPIIDAENLEEGNRAFERLAGIDNTGQASEPQNSEVSYYDEIRERIILVSESFSFTNDIADIFKNTKNRQLLEIAGRHITKKLVSPLNPPNKSVLDRGGITEGSIYEDKFRQDILKSILEMKEEIFEAFCAYCQSQGKHSILYNTNEQGGNSYWKDLKKNLTYTVVFRPLMTPSKRRRDAKYPELYEGYTYWVREGVLPPENQE